MRHGLSANVKTGRVHVYPVMEFDAEALGPDVTNETHVTSDQGFCWCQPTVEYVGMGHMVVHRRTLDSPKREEDDA